MRANAQRQRARVARQPRRTHTQNSHHSGTTDSVHALLAEKAAQFTQNRHIFDEKISSLLFLMVEH